MGGVLLAVDWSLMIGTFGRTVDGLDDVAQAVRVILTTPLRSDPHRPDFGCDLLPWIDLPAPVAGPGLAGAARDALERWEPRVEVMDVTVTRGVGDDGAGVAVNVTWRLVGSLSQIATTEVSIR